jgi:hypothetical protein
LAKRKKRGDPSLDEVFAREAEAITRKAVELALEGNPAMIKLVLERIAPLRKGRRIPFELPEINSAQDVAGAYKALRKALAEGELSPEEAAEVAKVIQGAASAIEQVQWEERISRLEAANQPRA